MENASKALLMAGGMLLALLTISILVFAFNRMSASQRTSNQDTAEQTTIEFNNQFSTYNNDRVRGSELYSCLNKAMDYNRRNTADVSNSEDEKYNWRSSQYKGIAIRVDFDGKVNQLYWSDDKLEGVDDNHIFARMKNEYTLSKTENEFRNLIGQTYDTQSKKSYEGKVQEIEGKYGGPVILNKLSKELGNIFAGPSGWNTDTEATNDIAKLEKFENIIVNPKTIHGFSSYEVLKDIQNAHQNLRDAKDDVVKNLNIIRYGTQTVSNPNTSSRSQLYKDVYKYYEYVQFKRAIFECTKCEYDKNTGRIIELDFKFTGKFN